MRKSLGWTLHKRTTMGGSPFWADVFKKTNIFERPVAFLVFKSM